MSNPSTAYATSFNGTVLPDVGTLFNFDIPFNTAGKTCSLVFLFPKQSQLTTSAFDLSGRGAVDFSRLIQPAYPGQTYNNAPAVGTDYGITEVAPGHNYTIATFGCPAEQTIAFALRSARNTRLTWFQDFNPSP